MTDDIMRLQTRAKVYCGGVVVFVISMLLSVSDFRIRETTGTITGAFRRPISCPDYGNASSFLLNPVQGNRSILASLSGLPNETRDDLFSSCQPTCQVRIIPGCPYWELQTLDCHKNIKTVGGDEFYLTYSDRALATAALQSPKGFWTQPASAVAWSVDRHNGRYWIDFQASPMSPQSFSGTGVFALYLQYTCGIGRMAYPLKETWPHGGQTVAWARSSELSIVPPIRSFELPTERPNLFSFANIIPVGDSLLQQFLEPLGIAFPNINEPLNSTTLGYWITFITNQINPRDLPRSVIIGGSCAWDIFEHQNASTSAFDGSREWQDHRDALTGLLTHVRVTYPQITMFWKSCAGFHIHVPYLYDKHSPEARATMESRLKYMSTSRADSIRKVQREVIQHAKRDNPGKVYLLDIYSAFYLSADLTRPGDGRHYNYALNVRASNWFANESMVENLWRERRPRYSARMTVEYSKGWLELVNAALVAKVTDRSILWEREPVTGPNVSTDTRFEGGFTHLLNRTHLMDEKYTRKNRSTQKFVFSLFDTAVSGSKYLYGMIFHRILLELSSSPSESLTPSEGRTIAFAPFSDPTKTTKLDRCLDEHLATASGFSSSKNGTAAPGCEILVPSLQWSRSIDPAIKKHNCTVRVQSFDEPNEILLVATQLAESFDSSLLILSCSTPASLLFLELLNYLLQARARRLGMLPFQGVFSHCCLT